MRTSKSFIELNTLLSLIAINALVYLLYMMVTPATDQDFRAFYSAGEAARQAPSHLYDLDYQSARQRSEFGDHANFLPFFHPPHEVLLFLPFSKFPYVTALNLWRLFSLFCLVASGLLLGRTQGLDRVTSVMIVLACFPVGLCLFLGQDSLLLLLLLCGCFYLLKQKRDVAAALVLSLALFKPQIPVILAVAVLATGRRKFFAWFAGAGAALASASLAFVGRQGVQYMLQGEQLAERTGIFKMATLRGLIAFVSGDHPRLAIALLLTALIGMFGVWRRSQSLDFAVSSAICVATIFTPYMHAYDLVVLAIPFVLLLRGLTQKHAPLVVAITSWPLALLVLAWLKIPSLLILLSLALGYFTLDLQRSPDPIDAEVEIG